MKLNTLYESYDLDEDDKKEIMQYDIIDWCKENLSSFNTIRDFEIDDDFVIHTPKVHIFNEIKTFPYKFTDVESVYIHKVDSLENFDNFPTCGNAPDITYGFNNLYGSSKKSGVDFSKLPVSEDVDSVIFMFDAVGYVTTHMLCDLHHNIEKIQFTNCDHTDLYDFEKYTLYVQDYYIVPLMRFKNFGSFLREEISYYSFKIVDDPRSKYKKHEISFLNDIFNRYNGKYNHSMDFVVELIDAGFEDEV